LWNLVQSVENVSNSNRNNSHTDKQQFPKESHSADVSLKPHNKASQHCTFLNSTVSPFINCQNDTIKICQVHVKLHIRWVPLSPQDGTSLD
jgi:hypothetical protein